MISTDGAAGTSSRRHAAARSAVPTGQQPTARDPGRRRGRRPRSTGWRSCAATTTSRSAWSPTAAGGPGLGAARRRDVDRGLRRRGLAGGSRPRRGAGVPLAAGPPPVLRGARQPSASLRCARAQRGQPGRPHRGPRRPGSPGRRAAGDRDRPGRRSLSSGESLRRRHRARGLPRRGVGDDARGVPAVRRGTAAAAQPTTSCTRSRTRPAGCGAELEQRAREGSENELEHSTAAWHRLLALFTAVHAGSSTRA